MCVFLISSPLCGSAVKNLSRVDFRNVYKKCCHLGSIKTRSENPDRKCFVDNVLYRSRSANPTLWNGFWVGRTSERFYVEEDSDKWKVRTFARL